MQGKKRTFVAAALILIPSGARAAQFTIVDVTYTHGPPTVAGSHYRVKPSAETPANWKAPVDYTQGKVYGHVQVFSKPNDNVTNLSVCFEGSGGYACTGNLKWSKPGVYEWNQDFSRMLHPDQVDWTKKPGNVALILKTGNYTNVEGALVAMYTPVK